MVEGRRRIGVFEFVKCAVVVTRPVYETLWAGGMILMHPESEWTVVTLCGGGEEGMEQKFSQAMEVLGAKGRLGHLDRAGESRTWASRQVQDMIAELLMWERFDLILTHALWGEFSGQSGHQDAARAVMALREGGRLFAKEIRLFAYEDGGGRYLPRPAMDADVTVKLPDEIWRRKYEIVTQIYGFGADGFEAKVTPKLEAFWVLRPGQKMGR